MMARRGIRGPADVETLRSDRPVSIKIDRLTFDGLTLSAGEARRAGAALELELSRLAVDGHWPHQGVAIPLARPPVLTITPGSPEQLGRLIARALFKTVREA